MSRIPESELLLNKDGSVYHLNLRPEHISDTIIAVGDPGRVHLVSKYFDKIDYEMNKREFITHTGKYKGRKITVISTGMGTDNIEIFLTELDALVNIDLENRVAKPKRKKLKIIRLGTTGALQEDIPLGSFIASDYAIGLDTLMQFYNLPQNSFELEITRKIQETVGLNFQPYMARGSQSLKEKVAFDMLEGNTLTCPGFYAPQGRSVRLEIKYPKLLDHLMRFHQDNFWLTNFEMETAGYYAMAKMMGHDIISLSSVIVNRVKKNFSKNVNKSVESLIQKTLLRLVP